MNFYTGCCYIYSLSAGFNMWCTAQQYSVLYHCYNTGKFFALMKNFVLKNEVKKWNFKGKSTNFSTDVHNLYKNHPDDNKQGNIYLKQYFITDLLLQSVDFYIY